MYGQRHILLAVACVLLTLAGFSAAWARGADLPAPGQKVAFLMTFGSADEVYEVFGHNALVIVDYAAQTEVAYNWGVFDFQQENFLARFIQGRMMYSMEGDDVPRTVRAYRARGRSVVVRQLNLSPLQLADLIRRCQLNDTDANRNYRYDYYTDNCSTRVRDMIDVSTGGQVAAALRGVSPAPTSPATNTAATTSTVPTLRFHTERLTQKTPWLYAGTHFLLGRAVDQPIDRWQECFLPAKLDEHLRSVTVKWEDGTTHPLVGDATTLVPETRGGDPAAPPSRAIVGGIYLALGLSGGTAIAALGWLVRRRAPGRAPGGAPAGRTPWLSRSLCGAGIAVWGATCTVAGSVCSWLWFFTDHAATRFNENWLQLNALSLPIAIVGAGLVLNRRWATRWAIPAATLPLALSVLGWLGKLLPIMTQPNLQILLLATPLHVGVWLAARKLAEDQKVKL